MLQLQMMFKQSELAPSRNFDDESDEYCAVRRRFASPVVSHGAVLSTKVLVIAHGDVATSFCRALFVLDRVVASVLLPVDKNDNADSDDTDDDRLTNVYTLKRASGDGSAIDATELLVAVCEHDVDDELCVEWCNALLGAGACGSE